MSEKNESSQLYEVGFHIVSTIDSSKIDDEIDAVRKIITKYDGEIVREGEVEEITLAYTMTKHIAGSNSKFSTAYFDWIKFNATPDNVVEIKNAFNEDPKVLRFLLTKTVDDDSHSTAKLAEMEEFAKESDEEKTEEVKEESLEEKTAKKEKKAKSKDSEVGDALDKAIDEMVK